MAGINVIFGGTSLQTSTILVDAIGHDQIPTKNLTKLKLARADGVKKTNVFTDEKTIAISGTLIGTSPSNLDTAIDTFKQVLSGEDQNLDIDWAGGTRRYVATLNALTIARGDTAAYAKFSAEFLVPLGFGKDTASTTLLGATTLTTQPTTTALATVGGTAIEQRPVITAVLNSFTGASLNTLTIKNSATGVGISVTRLWTAADSLVIDCENLTVKVNGTAVDYSGAFPTWPIGAANIGTVDDFSARNISLSATYFKRYL